MENNDGSLTISDRELVNYCGAGVIKHLRLVPEIIQVPSKAAPGHKGKNPPTREKRVYKVWIKGKWEENEILLITVRREARTWSSLDKAEEYFRNHFRYRGPILVMINGT